MREFVVFPNAGGSSFTIKAEEMRVNYDTGIVTFFVNGVLSSAVKLSEVSGIKEALKP
jgi:hypothetical protein